MAYTLLKGIQGNPVYEASFFQLAQSIFGLSFEEWKKQGFWTEQYLPYSIADGNTIIANASVNHMRTVWDGVPKHYIQIGTVMTSPAYRNQGLARHFLEEILQDWKHNCDSIYLYANRSVLNFYPRFGFQKAVQVQHCLPIPFRNGDFRKLNMDRPEDRSLLLHCYRRSNPFSLLPFMQNPGLLMFYCAFSMKHSVYYSPSRQTACIAVFETGKVTCLDLFGYPSLPLQELLGTLVNDPSIHEVQLGFTPIDPSCCRTSAIDDEEDTLFILKGKENLFQNHALLFPLLSHA